MMTIELTDSQRQALDARPDEPVQVVDPRTQEVYVLLRADSYARLTGFLREEEEEKAQRKAWLETATKARRAWVQENPY
jgi:hypothetical protein